MKQKIKKILAVIIVLTMIMSQSALLSYAIAENPIVSMTATAQKQLVKNFDGFWDTWYDENNNEYNYFSYHTSDTAPYFSLTLEDGSVIEGNIEYLSDYFSENYNYKVYYNVIDKQILEKWGTGKHTATMYLMLDDGFIHSDNFNSLAECEYEIEIIESPVESVTVEPLILSENIDGSWDHKYNEETGNFDGAEFFSYNLYFDFTVTLKDGTQINSDNNNEFIYNGITYRLKYSFDQYKTPLTVGTHEIPVSVLGYETTASVEIVENPVESVIVEPLTLIENADGWHEFGYNESTGDYDIEFFYYNLSFDYTVTLKDGTVYEKENGDHIEYNDNMYWVECYYEQFAVPLTVGTYEIPVSVLGYKTTASVEILENPVESVTFEPLTLIENADGYWDYGYNEETDENDIKYFCYNLNFDYTVTLKDGTVYEKENGDYIEYNDNTYSVNCHYDQSDDPLTVGTHEIPVSVLGYETTASVEIVENPVESVIVEPLTLIENGDGWYDFRHNESTGDYDIEFFYYNLIFDYIVTLKDGTVYEKEDNEAFEYNNNMYWIDYYYDQFEVPLTVGTYEIPVSVLGYETTASVEIVESTGEEPTTEPPTEIPTAPPTTEPPTEPPSVWDPDITEPTTEPPAQSLLLGDVDGDGYTTSADARQILRVSAGLESLDESLYNAANVHAENDVINAADARLALRISALLEPDFADAAPARTYLDAERSDTLQLLDETPIIAGWDFTIKVYSSDLAGATNGNLFFTYDPEILDFVSIMKASDDIDIAVGDKYEDGKISFAFAFQENANENDYIAEIKFKALKVEKTQIDCTIGTWDGSPTPYDCSIGINVFETTTKPTTTHVYPTETTTIEATTSTPTTEPPAEPLLLGDVDGDGYTTSADARYTLRIAAKLVKGEENQLVAADVTGDDYKITAADARQILRISAMLDNIENAAPARTYLDAERYDDVKITADIPECSIGEEITVTISAENMTGTTNGNLFFTYDSDVLEFVEIKKAYADFDLATGGNYADNKISFAFSFLECAIDDVPLATITFKALKAGETQLDCTVGTWDGSPAPADTSFTIKAYDGPTCILPAQPCITFNIPQETKVGDTFDVILSAEYAYGLDSGDIFINYDKDYLDFVNLSSDNSDPTAWTEYPDGKISFSFLYMTPVSESDKDLAVLTFKALKDGVTEITTETTSWTGTEIEVAEGYTQIPISPASDEYTFDYIEVDGGVVISGAYGSLPELVIPETIDGKPVIGINILGAEQATSVVIPDSVKFLAEDWIWNSDNITSVTLGKSVAEFNTDALANRTNLKSINVSAENETYSSADGVLYSKDGTKVIVYPVAKGDTFNLPVKVSDIDVIINRYAYNSLNVIPATDSAFFTIEDDVIYSKDKTKVIYCNPAKTGDYTMPDNVTAIGEKAFTGANVNTVSISPNVNEIVYAAFADCTALETVSVPKSVKSIGANGFAGCTSLKEITLPDGMTSIGYRGFANCTALETADLGNGIDSLGNSVFLGCTSLKKTVLSKQLETIPTNAFESCTSLTDVTFPEELKTIGSYAFFQCTSLSNINLPEKLEYIAYDAFGYSGLTSLELPDSVKTIEFSAFSECVNLQSVKLSAGLKEIPEHCFRGCTALSEIITSDNIDHISSSAFRGTAYVENDSNYENGLLYIGKVLYCANDKISETITIKEGTKSITDSVFEFNSKIKKVIFPDSLKFIDTAAFKDCQNLTEADLPANLEVIGFEAFANTAITSVKIPATITNIVYGAYSPSPVEKIEMPDGLVPMGEYNFKDTPWYDSQPEGEIYLGTAFYNYKGEMPEQTEITIKDGTMSIAGAAFIGRSNLVGIKLPDTIVDIGPRAFFNTGLKNIEIPSSVTTIRDRAFTSNMQLESIKFNSGLKYIGEEVFEYCYMLTSVELPYGTELIGDYAFYGCSGLEKITIPSTVTEIGYLAFQNAAENFTIHAPTGSYAEEYAKANGINFVAIEEDVPETDKPSEPSTDAPEKPSQPVEKPVSDKLEVKGDAIKVDESSKISTIKTDNTVESLAKSIGNANFTVVDKDGKELAKDALVGTGSVIQIKDNSGKVINEYTVCVPNDVDGNGKTTAADARLALRGSAKMENVDGVYALASDVTGDGKITAADARQILRVSAGLEEA